MGSIAILGAGAVGGLLAALLARSGADTTVVARERTAAAIGRDGIAVDSVRWGSFRAWPATSERLATPVDVLLVAVKAPALPAALQRIDGEPALVVPLLNGVEHMLLLRERFDDRVLAATVRVQAHRQGAAHVVHRAPFMLVTLAAPGAPALAGALADAGVDVVVGAGEPAVLWGKLARLAGLALATAAAGAPLGEVREDALAVAAEVVAVANAQGAGLDRAVIAAELAALPDAASSSLAADVAAGAEHELDAIAGAVLRAAARAGLECPRTAALAAQIALRTR